MIKSRFLLVLPLVAVWLLAACGAEVSQRMEDWGAAVDPDHDCNIKMEKGELVVSVPGTAHDLSAELKRMNAPRILQEVEGDFIVQVKVTGNFAPKTKTIQERKPYHGAGLLVMKDEKNYVRLEHGVVALPDDEDGLTFVNFELRKDATYEGFKTIEEAPSNTYPLAAEEMAYLRLERRGEKLAAAVSADGLHWRYLPAKTATLPAKVQVGVAAVSSAKEPFAPHFSALKVSRLK